MLKLCELCLADYLGHMDMVTSLFIVGPRGHGHMALLMVVGGLVVPSDPMCERTIGSSKPWFTRIRSSKR